MTEKFYYSKGENYELFVQVTDNTSEFDVLTIIHQENNWKEESNQYSDYEYQQLVFPKTYQQINEEQFEKAQNEILKIIGTTRSGLTEKYRSLWHEYLVEKLEIEERLITSSVDFTNHWEVTEFRERQAFEVGLYDKKQKIYDVFNQNDSKIISNEDIFNKASSKILNSYLIRRAKIQAKAKK
jgi:hypothetical protein